MGLQPVYGASVLLYEALELPQPLASPSLPPTFDTGLWGGLETGKLGKSRIVVARQGPFDARNTSAL